MNDANAFDILLQFDEAAIKDLQIRSLNTSLATNHWLKSPISRLIDYPMPQQEIKAHWNKPEVSIEENQVEISAEVKGGARQILTGHILTVEGEVSIRREVMVDSDKSGRPYTCLKAPDPVHLHVKKLKVTYEGAKESLLPSIFDPTRETTALRPVLTKQLMTTLASQPLTFFPHSLPIGVQTETKTSSEVLPVMQAVTSIVQKRESVILGLMLNTRRPAPTLYATLLPAQSRYNAALSISTSGLNALLAHLCQRGQAAGKHYHPQWGDVSWQWEQLSVILGQGTVQLTGILLQSGQRIGIQAEALCLLDENGILRCGIISSNTGPAIAEIVQASWITLLHQLLAVPEGKMQAQDPYAKGRLWQRFDIPGTQSGVEAPAQGLRIVQGQLVIFYHIPKTQHKLQFEIPDTQPTFAVIQTHIPRQVAPGAPVAVHLKARAIKESAAPYDHIWTIGETSEPRLEHGSQLTIKQIPRPVLKPTHPGQPQELTTVKLKTIDIFGQVTEVPLPVQYIPYHKANKSTGKHHYLRASIPVLLVLLAVIAIVLTRFPGILPNIFAHPNNTLKPANTYHPSVHMPDTVESGQSFELKGINFPPLLPAIIHIDLPNAPNNTPSTAQQAMAETNITGALSSLIMQNPTQSRPAEIPVTVDGNGKFTIMVPTGKDWPHGSYIVHVLRQNRQQLTNGKFQINADTPVPTANPCISVDQTSLPFAARQGQGDNPAPQTVTIKNCGKKSENITAKTDTHNGGSWLSTSDGGQLEASYQMGLSTSVNIQGLSAGQYTGSIALTIQDANGVTVTQQIAVNLIITHQCTINVNQTLPTFRTEQGGYNPAVQSLPVVSDCPGTITTHFSTNNGGAWLGGDRGGQIDTSSPLNINVSAYAQNLPADQYRGTIDLTFQDSNGTTVTQQVPVTLNVSPPCKVTVGQTILSFVAEQGGYNPRSQTLSIDNRGCSGTVTTSTSTDDGNAWLNTNQFNMQVAAGQSPFTISVNSQHMTQGTYTGIVTITFQDTNGVTTTQTVATKLTISPMCTIMPAQSTLTFTTTQGGKKPSPQTVTVTNTCGGNVSTHANGGSWLSTSKGTNLTTAGQFPITVSVDNQHMVQGTYTGSVDITFKDANGVTVTQPIAVSFNVSAPCGISVQTPPPFTIEQGTTTPAQQSVPVTANCAGTIKTSVNGTAWLSADKEGTLTAPSQLPLNVFANSKGLNWGTYKGTLTITFQDTNGGPPVSQKITVTLNVTYACIKLVPDTLAFTAKQGDKNPVAQRFTVQNCGSAGTITTNVSANDGDDDDKDNQGDADDVATWLNADSGGSLASSPAQLPINVSVNTKGLIADASPYRGYVNVTLKDASGTPITKQVPVTFTIMPLPCMSPTPPTLDFTAEQGMSNPAAKSFTVTDCGKTDGKVTTDITTSKGGTWLSVTPKEGTLSQSGPLTITVAVNSQNLSKGDYSGSVNLTFTDSNGNITTGKVTVNLTMTKACISTVPDKLDFTVEAGTNKVSTQSFTVNNCGNAAGTVTTSTDTTSNSSSNESTPTGNASSNSSDTSGTNYAQTYDGIPNGSNTSWLSASPGEGPLSLPGQLPIDAIVNTQGLTQGPYTGHVYVTFIDKNNGKDTKTVKINLTVAPPCTISTSPTTLSFTTEQGQKSNPPSQNFTAISNCAGTVTVDANGTPWLSVGKGGKLNAESHAQYKLPISVAVNSQSMTTGPYSGPVTVTLADSYGATHKITLTVNLTITPPPCITVTPTTGLTFTAEQGTNNVAAQSFTVSNCGKTAGTVTTAASGANWLNTGNGGNLAVAGQLPISVSVNSQGLSRGTYNGSVKVTLTDASGSIAAQQVSVNLIITKACITVTPGTLTFTAEQGASNLDNQSFTISNCGDTGTVTIAVSGASWLTVGQGSTLNADGQLAITASVNSQSLSSGTYSGSVSITLKDTNGGTSTQSVTAKLTVVPPCTISVNPTQLSFTAEQGQKGNPASQNFTATSSCGGTVTTAASGGSWLGVSKGSTLNANEQLSITVSANTADLHQGQYTGTVTVTLGDIYKGTHATTLTVNLTITPPPCISVQPTALTFTTYVGVNPASQSLTVTNCGNTAGTLTTSSSNSKLGADTGKSLGASGQASISVSVNAQGLAVGQYTYVLYVTMTDVSGASTTISVNVTLTVATSSPR